VSQPRATQSRPPRPVAAPEELSATQVLERLLELEATQPVGCGLVALGRLTSPQYTQFAIANLTISSYHILLSIGLK